MSETAVNKVGDLANRRIGKPDSDEIPEFSFDTFPLGTKKRRAKRYLDDYFKQQNIKNDENSNKKRKKRRKMGDRDSELFRSNDR